jgi:hypothetical protein
MAMNTTSKCYGSVPLPNWVHGGVPGVTAPKEQPPVPPVPAPQPIIPPPPVDLEHTITELLKEASDKFLRGEITAKQLKDLKKSLE